MQHFSQSFFYLFPDVSFPAQLLARIRARVREGKKISSSATVKFLLFGRRGLDAPGSEARAVWMAENPWPEESRG
jgi:hypothetical protein